MGRMKTRVKLDFQRLKQLNNAVKIPLVIHGGSGLDEDQFRRLTSLGVAKINYYTELSDIAAQTMSDRVKAGGDSSFTDLKQGIKEAVGRHVESCMRQWGSAGRVAEVLTQCEPWTVVEHLIIYNVVGMDDAQAQAMMAEGRKRLSVIPGVREIFTGEASKEGAKYQFCWLARFTHPAVIESYRNHPAHIDFSDNLFRPHAGERISIDFKDNAAASNKASEGGGAIRWTTQNRLSSFAK